MDAECSVSVQEVLMCPEMVCTLDVYEEQKAEGLKGESLRASAFALASPPCDFDKNVGLTFFLIRVLVILILLLLFGIAAALHAPRARRFSCFANSLYCQV